jgi:hypothetical protein
MGIYDISPAATYKPVISSVADPATPEQVMAMADTALYKAKHVGYNRYMIRPMPDQTLTWVRDMPKPRKASSPK